MSNIIQDRIPPIEGLKLEIKLPAAHLKSIRAAVAQIDTITERARSATAQALSGLAKGIAKQFAQGSATLEQAVAISSLAGTSDALCQSIAGALQDALHSEERAARASATEAIIEAFTLRTEALRLRVAAIETAEQEQADICGIPFEASETAKRLRATFELSLDRLRAIRDRGELASKAELRELASA
jgi:hypothetical protein